MLCKHSPHQFCHVEEMCFNNLHIFPMAAPCTENKMLVPHCLQGLSVLVPGCLLNLKPCCLPIFTSVQSSNPQIPPCCQALSGLRSPIPFCSLPGMTVSQIFGWHSCPQVVCHHFSKVFSHHSVWKCPLHLTLSIQYLALFSSQDSSRPEEIFV